MAKPNIKELVVNHFEKGIFAVACLLGLAVLAGTRWAPYDHYPNEITRAVNEGEQALAGKTWPEEEQEKFVVPENETIEAQVAMNVGHPIDPTPFEFDVSFSPGLYDSTKPITEPEFMSVAALMADAGRFLMAEQPERDSLQQSEEDPLMADTDTEEEEDLEGIPEEFQPRETTRRGAGTPGAPGSGLGTGYGGYDDYGADYGMQAEMAGGALGGYEEGYPGGYGEGEGYPGGYDEGYPGGYGGEMGMGRSASMMEGRGLRYVAVRGIIPLREQIRKYMKAIHVSFPQAADLYEIIEFELQRKKMRPGDDPWGGDWEEVDIEIAKETLEEALMFDPDVVQGSITDSAVTMPLPGRITGVWKSKATHPMLENFTLSEDEIQQELEFNRLLLQKHQERQANEPEIVEKGGFSDISPNKRGMQMGGMGMEYYGEAAMEDFDYGDYGMESGAEGYGMGIGYAPTSQGKLSRDAEQWLKELEQKGDLGQGDEERDKALLEYIQERITAQGELLLFRYFDFDVEPGATYKYRAKLIVRNPNFDRPVAQVAGLAHIVKGQTRETKWSDETEPATVPPDVDYFVDKVEMVGTALKPRMALFQWNPDFGTTVFSTVEVGFGQEVGGTRNTLVLDPAKESFEVEKYTFHTGDVLIDALIEDKVDKREHPDLQLPRGARGGELGISGQVLISQGSGDLAVIDHLSRVSAFKSRNEYLKYERDPFEDIKNRQAKKPDANEMDSYYGEYGGYGSEYEDAMMGGMMEGAGYGGQEDYGRGRRGRGGGDLRKRSSRRGSPSRSPRSSRRR